MELFNLIWIRRKNQQRKYWIAPHKYCCIIKHENICEVIFKYSFKQHLYFCTIDLINCKNAFAANSSVQKVIIFGFTFYINIKSLNCIVESNFVNNFKLFYLFRTHLRKKFTACSVCISMELSMWKDKPAFSFSQKDIMTHYLVCRDCQKQNKCWYNL